LNHVVGGFFRGPGIARHVVTDVVFHQFSHQAVDGPTGGGQALENFSASVILGKAAEDAL